MLCLRTKWLFPFRDVQTGQSDFQLLFVYEDGEGVTISDVDDLAILGGSDSAGNAATGRRKTVGPIVR